MVFQVSDTFILSPAYNEFGYNEHHQIPLHQNHRCNHHPLTASFWIIFSLLWSIHTCNLLGVNSPHNCEKLVDNPLLNFSVHAKGDQIVHPLRTVQPMISRSLRNSSHPINRRCEWIQCVTFYFV